MTISEVRAAYVELRERALRVNPGQAGYINDLWSTWDQELARFDGQTLDRPYVEFMTRTIADPRLHADDILEWLDAYPDAIRDRLPGGLMSATA